jgi:DNA-nicking Smr family endonuclease
MARRKKPRGAAPPVAAPAPFHSPFRTLKKLVPRDVPPASVRAPHARPASTVDAGRTGELTGPVSDQLSFREAMEDVIPLGGGDRGRVDPPAPAGTGLRAPVGEEAEALAALGDLVSGAGALDVTDTDEYVEGAVVGLDPRIVRRVRKGAFSYQAHLDLHHMTVEEARVAVGEFLSTAYRKGQRCVLIIHGRGRNSKDQIPVLKERLKVWLGHSGLAKYVLAFTTARPVDGGAGALYVLLRRRRRQRAPFVVTDGAKR